MATQWLQVEFTLKAFENHKKKKKQITSTTAATATSTTAPINIYNKNDIDKTAKSYDKCHIWSFSFVRLHSIPLMNWIVCLCLCVCLVYSSGCKLYDIIITSQILAVALRCCELWQWIRIWCLFEIDVLNKPKPPETAAVAYVSIFIFVGAFECAQRTRRAHSCVYISA